MITTTHPDRGATAPGRLLYLTEPARAVVDFGLLVAAAPLLAMLPHAQTSGGHPVLVLPGLGSADSSTSVLRVILRRLGYRTYGWGLGRNSGPTTPVVNGMRARLDTLTDRFATPVSLIGWSLGGVYARQLARRKPDSVRQVITLGTPVGLTRKRLPKQQPTARGAAGNGFGENDGLSAVPQWPHWSEWARWYAGLQAGMRDLPLAAGDGTLPVPTTSIYSRLDGVVGWRICRDVTAPHTESIAVTAASHLGLGYHPAVIWAIADRLAQPAGRWAPFQPPALLRAAYWEAGGQS